MSFSSDATIHVEKEKREREYKELHDSPRSPFKGMHFWNIFITAMAIGYHQKVRAPLSGARHDLFQPARTLGEKEEWLIRSIAVAEKGDVEELIGKESEILKTAEEYANGGIFFLYDSVFGGDPGDPVKKLETIATDIYDRLGSREDL